MVKPQDLTLDQLLYNTVLFLIQNNRQSSAELLVECELDSYEKDEYPILDYDEVVHVIPFTCVTLAAPHSIQPLIGTTDPGERFEDSAEPQQKEEYQQSFRFQIEKAFEVILRARPVLIATEAQLVVGNEEDWREHLKQLLKGEKTTNQGNPSSQRKPVVVWNNLNFWSKAEKMIAEALDRAGVMYLPNCMARLGPPEHRHNKEPDFLVCCGGKWGIFEVDGKAFHQEAAQDHERDRQFRQQGIKVIERFSGQRCLEEPDEVVQTFIRILQQNG